jgi:hypothetical protein
MYWSRNSGNVLFLILIAVALFAALSYAVTQSTGGGVIDITQEQNELNQAKSENYESAINTAIWRLTIVNGCDTQEISYETPSGDYINPSAPPSRKCHIFFPEGGGVPYTDYVPSGAVDNDPASFAGNFNDLSGQNQNTLLTSNSVTISDINVLETITVSGGGSPEFSINGGGWLSGSSSVQDGDSIQLRAYTPAASGASNNIEVTVGSQSDIWTIETTACHADTGDACQYWGTTSSTYLGCTNAPFSNCQAIGGTNANHDNPCGPNTHSCYQNTTGWINGTRQCNGSCS